jgi:hypothetical protein
LFQAGDHGESFQNGIPHIWRQDIKWYVRPRIDSGQLDGWKIHLLLMHEQTQRQIETRA